MKKILLLILIIALFSLNANENAKEKKVAKYVMENIQKDYVTVSYTHLTLPTSDLV